MRRAADRGHRRQRGRHRHRAGVCRGRARRRLVRRRPARRLRRCGWAGLDLRRAAGVVVVGKDPTTLGQAVADPLFRSRMAQAVRSVPAVFADRHMAAALGGGGRRRPIPRMTTTRTRGSPTSGRTTPSSVRVWASSSASAVPTLTYDYRWGRLFALGQHDRSHLAVGLGEETAVVLGATGQGGRLGSVAVLDSRQASYSPRPTEPSVRSTRILDTFAPGERFAPAR